MKHGRRERGRRRQRGAIGAIGRALLIAGPLAAALVVGVAPRAERSAGFGGERLDTVATGSIGPSRVAFASPGYAGSRDGCLRFPDGSHRGTC